MLEKTVGAFKNGESRDTGNIGYTRHRTKTNKTTKCQRKPKAKGLSQTQDEDNQNKKTIPTQHNSEK